MLTLKQQFSKAGFWVLCGTWETANIYTCLWIKKENMRPFFFFPQSGIWVFGNTQLGYSGASTACGCVTLKRKGTEIGGRRKLSSQPQEVGLPKGCRWVSERMRRRPVGGVWSQRLPVEKISSVYVLAWKPEGPLQKRWKKNMWLKRLCRCEKKLVGFRRGS